MEITRSISDVIIQHAAFGAPMSVCAKAAGVTVKILNEWRARGEEDIESEDKRLQSSMYAQFVRRLLMATGNAASEDLRNLRAFADEDWRASAWLLEHCYGGEFAKRTEVTVEDVSVIPPSVLDAEAKRLLEEDDG